MTIARGEGSSASVAGIGLISVSGFCCEPLPAMVSIVPSVFTLRIRAFSRSIMYNCPILSNATPMGLLSCALVARSPSPSYPLFPEPAKTVAIPSVSALRIL